MARITVTGSVNVDSLSWSNFDNLLISNGATVTINTPQIKCWKNINVDNGQLYVENTSSTTPIRLLMGRNSGATANIISGSTGLGSIIITGSWIYLDTGSGVPNQTLTQPYTDFVPAVWVETASGSNTFEPWLNITTQVGESHQYFKQGLEFAFSGSMGNFFTQETISEPYPASFTGSVSSSLSSSIRSGVSLLYSSSLYFGNGIDGNVIPEGARIRIPNIMVTDVTPLNLLSATSVTSANFVGTTGCVFRFNTVLFDESYGNFTQPQVLEMKNCGWAEYPLITECYSLTLENVALTAHPIRRYFPSANAGWTTRDLRWGTQCAWSYISNAIIDGLYICNYSPTALIAAVPSAGNAAAVLYISLASNLQVNNLKLYNLYRSKNSQYCLTLYYINDSTFDNVELYGGDYMSIFYASNNIFNAITASYMFGNHTPSFNSSWRFATDPTTNQPLQLGTPYYLKTRSYRSWQNVTGSFPENNVYYYQTGSEFVDSVEYSFTPYTASRISQSYRNHPDYFGVWPLQSTATTLTIPTASSVWVQRAPSIGYEIYRYTESKSPIRDGRTLVYSSSTVATVTYTSTSSLNKPLEFDVPTYYVLRKYDGNLDGWSESTEQECIIRSPTIATNYLRQSSGFSSGEWVKTGVTATADQRIGPNDAPIGTSAVTTADLLLFTSNTGNVTATSSLATISGSIYTFSIYLSSLTSSVSMSLSASSGTTKINTPCVINQKWRRVSLPFTASATTASVGIYANSLLPANTKVYAFGAQLNTSQSVNPYIPTTTAVVTQLPAAFELSSIRNWSRGEAGCGVEVQFGVVPAGTIWWELFLSATSSFTPSKRTLVASSWAVGTGNAVYLNYSINNIFNGFLQITPSGYGGGFIALLNGSSNNKFYNFNIDFNYGGGAAFIINTLSNENLFHNWYVKNYRNYISNYLWGTVINNAQTVTFQNLYSNNSDIPISSANLDTKCKNISAANGRPVTSTSAYSLAGSVTDQNAISYGQVYDTIFNEFVWTPPSGSMTLNFNASAKQPSPYIITGSLFFSNTGRLYFNSTGSIEYTWPWKIYGISGFRPSHLLDAGTGSFGNAYLDSYIVNTIDLGQLNYVGYALKKEIAFKTGSDWGPYYLMTGSNVDYISQSFNPSVGFNMKVKLTARPALKFDGQGTTATSSFIVGEYITGSISSASALIIDQDDYGTTGTLVLDEITGSFRDNEVLKVGVLNKGLANGTGSVSYTPNNILLPQPTSYIASMQWFTVVNTSSLYPITSPTLTVSGMKSGSKIDVIRQSDSYILDASYVSSDDIDYEFVYDYFQDTPVYLIIQNLGYIYQRLDATLTDSDLTIPVQQIIDRNYSNPVGP